MPRCFLYSARDYRTGEYYGGKDHDNNVMTTRSGLSIKKVAVTIRPSAPPPSVPPQDDDATQRKPKEEERTEKPGLRTKKYKPKSLSHISFVTRYFLCVRAPEYDLAGFDVQKRSRLPENKLLDNYRKFLETFEKEHEELQGDSYSDSENISNLDNFILSTAENVNNNKVIEDPVDDLTVLSTDKGSNRIKTIREEENQLVNFFSRNRLETEYVQKCRPVVSYASLLNELTVTEGPLIRERENSNDATNDKMSDSDVDAFYGLEGGSQNSGIDSEDNASTCSDSLLGRGDSNDLIVKPSHSSDTRCINSNAIQTYTKTVKLRDVHLKLNIIDVAGGQRVIKCPDCDFITTSIDMYVPHLRDHMRNKNACFLCGKLFSRSWLLKGHMRTHTGEKPFPCPHMKCQKAFADKSNLRSHFLTHSVKEKNHRCERCGRYFAQKRYLHKHNLEVCRVGLDSPASTSSGSATPTATSTSFGPATTSIAAATSSLTTESQGTCPLICTDV